MGHADDQGLVNPKAFVVLREGYAAGAPLAEEIKALVKQELTPFKSPRWVEFLPALPKSATGKTQRYKLRA